MGDRLKHSLMSVKRALLPLIPDAAMAQYRFRREQFRARFGLHQQRSLSRTNVDVVVERSSTRKWLLSSPDTVRVIDPGVPNEHPSDLLTVPSGTDPAGTERLLGWQGITAVVIGRVEEPRWGHRTSGTEIEPTAIVTTHEVIAEVGGVPPGDRPLPGLLSRISGAGNRIGLIPHIAEAADPRRTDPIDAEPIVILAAVPLHDVGGGSRGAQIALELARLGYHVMYVNMYPSYESVDLGLRFIHPKLEQVSFPQFDAGNHVERCSPRSGIVIVELPDPAYEPTLAVLKASGWMVVADLIDDWSDPALGGEWYDRDYEHDFITGADAVVASAPDLVVRAAEIGRDDAVLVPNGVNASVFGRDARERPADLPAGTVIGYHGSLYGDWIDWSAIIDVAEANVDASVVLIGEERNVPRNLPSNVILLGLRAQGDLPEYLQHFSIGFIPFAVTPTTHAVSPLKVYEYLASGLAVAAPPLRSLEGLSDLYVDLDLVPAVSKALSAPPPDRTEALGAHSWQQRISVLLEAVERTLEPTSDVPVRIVQRPVTHYGWNERHVRERP
jgi:hypothetical protein